MRQVGPLGVESVPYVSRAAIDTSRSAVAAVPLVTPTPMGSPGGCRDRLVELGRLEWRLGDAGDPAQTLEDFLARYGLPVVDLAAGPDPSHRAGGAYPSGTHPPDRLCGTYPAAWVCGAAVLVGAAAAARMTGAPAGPATPAPAVPDLVAIVYGHDEAPRSVVPAAGHWSVGPWQDSWTAREHADAVRRVRAAIGRGDVYQVNVVGHARARYSGDPARALHRLSVLPGARYGGVLAGAGWAVACASPETLVEVVGGRIVTRPIKGTRPATPVGRRELLASAKERAEHVMIVDLERNDLARVARIGSVRVTDLFAIRRWCGLWQAESTVEADLRPGVGLAELLRAVCPGGSVTGAPKLAALAEIAGLEPVGRGPAMGLAGWVAADRIDLGLTIRTAAADGEHLHLWAGGGITWGSDPAAEVAEAAAKAGPLRAALTG
ncbi:chorismate-binding protein [Plantactinospora sp. GCM10030261]|uniref:chorismate-binding protein n=1 Tax=Plantactinospora sp. GCM10030261 TaxID=3273420 RepID=UPI003621D9BC